MAFTTFLPLARPSARLQSTCFLPPASIARPRVPVKNTFRNRAVRCSPLASAASGPDNVALIAPPPAAFQAAVTLGTTKAGLKTVPILVLGFAAGAYLALGGLLALSVGGAVPGMAAANPGLQKLLFAACGLPIGLTLVVTTGAELFLGNCMLLTAAALSGKVTWGRVVQHWALAWTGNFAGAVSVAAMVVAAKAVSPAAAAAVVGLATVKTTQAFPVMVMRGVICNWLVCLGVYLANASRDFASKFLVVTMCVTTFVALGMDNCVANMFFIPLGIYHGAEISTRQFLLGNLLPVTLGNLLGGALMVGCLYFVCYGKRDSTPKKEMQVPERKLALD